MCGPTISRVTDSGSGAVHTCAGAYNVGAYNVGVYNAGVYNALADRVWQPIWDLAAQTPGDMGGVYSSTLNLQCGGMLGQPIWDLVAQTPGRDLQPRRGIRNF